jgi:hypothetical protein
MNGPSLVSMASNTAFRTCFVALSAALQANEQLLEVAVKHDLDSGSVQIDIFV